MTERTKPAPPEAGAPEELGQYERSLLDAAQYLVGQGIELGQWAPYLNWGARLASPDAEHVLRTPAIVEAFAAVNRYDFLIEANRAYNGSNRPLDIGHGQTNSQPSTVGQMQEWLQPRSGDRVLDVGSGSGWTTTLMAKVVGAEGEVIGVERIPELVKFGRDNLAKYAFSWAEIRQADEEALGLPTEAPFDKILVSAHLPEAWLEDLQLQLDPEGGRLVAPVASDEQYGQSGRNCEIRRVSRHGETFKEEVVAKDYGFVPIVHKVDTRFTLSGVN